MPHVTGTTEVRADNVEPQLSIFGKFRDQSMEKAFLGIYEAQFSSKMRTLFYTFCSLLALLAFVIFVSARDNCFRCSDKVFVGLGGISLGSAFVSCALALWSGSLLRRSQEISYAICSLLMSLGIILEVFWCPTWKPAEADGNKYAMLPDPQSINMIQLLIDISFLHFSSVPWPSSLVLAGPSMALHMATWCSTFTRISTEWFVDTGLTMFLGISVVSLVSAGIAGRQRRIQFAASIQVERDIRIVSSEKTATATLTRALFPKEIAERVIVSRHKMMKSKGSSVGQITSSTWEYIAESSESASIVIMTVDGIERIEPYDAQLDTLSRVFIAADHVAETNGAVKIKTIGTTMQFACGVTVAASDHTGQACRLAIDLQRMMTAFNAGTLTKTCKLVLKVGIASGPVVSGVIGMSKPKFDVWGYTLKVAEKLAQSAAAGAVLVTKAVAQSQKDRFAFRVMKRSTAVQDIGRILVFNLVVPYAAASEESSHSVVNTAPDAFDRPDPKAPIATLAEMAISIGRRRNAMPRLGFYTLQFKDKSVERKFMGFYADEFRGFPRWVSLVYGIFFLAFQIYESLAFPETNTIVQRFLEALNTIGVFSVFVLSFVPWLQTRPRINWALVCACGTVSLLCQLWLYDAGILVDPPITSMAGLLIWIFYCKQPFTVSLPMAAVLTIGTVPMYLVHHWAWSVLVFEIGILFLYAAIQIDFEIQARTTFAAGLALERYQRQQVEERERHRSLLESVVPKRVLDRLLEGPKGNFLAEFVPSGTTLVCTIDRFEGLLRSMSPTEVVKLLNSLFTHFDRLSLANGLEPLRTNADEYIVVGNVLSDMDSDHTTKVVRLAGDMIRTLKEFNDVMNPSSARVALKIGIHTSPLLTGVIRMKSFVFDVWGPAVPIAEQLSLTAPNNTIVISQETLSIISGPEFAEAEAMPPLLFGSAEFPRFAITLSSTTTSKTTSISAAEENHPIGSDLYGVYTGAPGEVIDRDYVIAQGFIPVDDDEIPHPVNVPIEMTVTDSTTGFVPV